MGNQKQNKSKLIVLIMSVAVVIIFFVYFTYGIINTGQEKERQKQLRYYDENEESRKDFDWCDANVPNVSLPIIQRITTGIGNCCYIFKEKFEGDYRKKQICWAIER